MYSLAMEKRPEPATTAAEVGNAHRNACTASVSGPQSRRTGQHTMCRHKAGRSLAGAYACRYAHAASSCGPPRSATSRSSPGASCGRTSGASASASVRCTSSGRSACASAASARASSSAVRACRAPSGHKEEAWCPRNTPRQGSDHDSDNEPSRESMQPRCWLLHVIALQTRSRPRPRVCLRGT